LEGLGGKASYHFHYQSGINSQGKPIEGSENGYLKTSYTGWHTYAVVWTTTTLTYYYDGAPVGSINSSVTDAPQFLVLSYEVGDHTAADPGAYGGPIVTPDTMQVDYVRVWN
jgi:beta-glucanase (GH16 family)